jgi:predicted nucleic acid-binding protein
MNPPSTLLDFTFLWSVATADDSRHNEAVALYRQLIDDFVGLRCLLVARADHLVSVASPELFAPIDKIHIAKQHRTAASRIADPDVDSDLAITLVLLQRLRIEAVASFDDRLAGYDLNVVSCSDPA